MPSVEIDVLRNELIENLEQYVNEYNGSWFYGRNHNERAKSVLSVLKSNIDNQNFIGLVEQQACLLQGNSTDISIGKPLLKHNQPVKRRMSNDKFTQSINYSYSQLQLWKAKQVIPEKK